MGTYYNEIDPYAAAWLRNLIAAGHLPAGDVDERSIVDVRGDDLRGYGACHFFAGIGGWPLALRLAGVPDDASIWTGSCPCQPFSVAGSGKGAADERHLWPAFHALIAERRPSIVIGEQVASASGRLWLSGVRADLADVGYAVGAADLCAAGVGAPHIRQRLYWLAHADAAGRGEFRGGGVPSDGDASRGDHAHGRGTPGGLAHTGQLSAWWTAGSGEATRWRPSSDIAGYGAGGLGEAIVAGLEGHAGDGDDGREPGRDDSDARRSTTTSGRVGAWDQFELVHFPDGKVRRIEPGVTPLASRISGDVGRLRAYGNAIVVPLASEFVMAAMEALE